MRALASLLMVIAMPAEAQTVPVTSAPVPTQAPAPWNPAGPYISEGQDEPGYRNWYQAAPERGALVKSFNTYLVDNQVGGILPTWQLLRTATSWRDCGGQPFEVPPTEEWPHIVQTLRYVHDYVVPAIGPVEAVSVYRNPALNVCAGGAPESAHKEYSAIDMVPLRRTTRAELMRTLCGVHNQHGERYSAGLGFYAYLRFHVDSTKYRRWNMDPAVAKECPAIIHPEDAASVGQPLPPVSSPLTAPGQGTNLTPQPAPATTPSSTKTERGH